MNTSYSKTQREELSDCVVAEFLTLCLYLGKEYIVGTNESHKPGNGLYDVNIKNVTIPYSYNGIDIKEIGHDAFHSTFIENVIIFASLRQINTHAFFNCRSLQSIQIPSSVYFIGWRAFSQSRVQNIFIEGGSVLKIIGAGAFKSYSPTNITFCNKYIPNIETTDDDSTPFPNGGKVYYLKQFEFGGTNMELIQDNRCSYQYRKIQQTSYCYNNYHIQSYSLLLLIFIMI